MVNPLIIAVLVFAVYFILHALDGRIGLIYAITAFLFLYSNAPEAQTMAAFYVMAGTVALTVALSFAFKQLSIYNKGDDVPFVSTKNKIIINVIGIFIGLLIVFVMFAIGNRYPGQVIGVPSLAIQYKDFSIAAIGLLGVIENAFFFTLFVLLDKAVLKKITILPMITQIPFFPAALITSVAFAGFHLLAYGVWSIFAVMIMFLWLGIFNYYRTTIAQDTAHMVWNSIISASKQLSIFGG